MTPAYVVFDLYLITSAGIIINSQKATRASLCVCVGGWLKNNYSLISGKEIVLCICRHQFSVSYFNFCLHLVQTTKNQWAVKKGLY